jgi:crotonobetainyl-CoA:carnitine CoA-transferase CaiB-like acyl-CoA transferase
VTPATLLGDIGGGALYLVAGMLAGLLKARETGKGTVVDAAIVDGAAHMMALLMAMRPGGGLSRTRGQSLLDGPHWSRCYVCADGGYLSVQCLEAKFYAEFLARLGLAQDPQMAPQHDPALWPVQAARLAGLFAGQPRAHWLDLFEGSDACVAPVLSPEDAAQDTHMQARGTWLEAHGMLQPAAAPRFDGAPPAPPKPPPDRGADTQAILAELEDTPE